MNYDILNLLAFCARSLYQIFLFLFVDFSVISIELIHRNLLFPATAYNTPLSVPRENITLPFSSPLYLMYLITNLVFYLDSI